MRKFLTSLPGFMTGLAAVITATATIVTVLYGFRGQPAGHPAGSTSAPGQASQAGSSSPAPDTSTPGPRLQWGPGGLLLTNDPTDFSSTPPQSTTGAGDVYVGNGLDPMAGTKMAVWSGSGTPSPGQCLNQAQTQSSGQGVPAIPGSVVCVLTQSGLIVIIRMISVDSQELTIETKTSVWVMPGS